MSDVKIEEKSDLPAIETHALPFENGLENREVSTIEPTVLLELHQFPSLSVTPELERRLSQIDASVSASDWRSRSYFGEEPMRNYGRVLKDSLNGLRNRDGGEAGQMIVELKTKLRGLRLDRARKEAISGKEGSFLGGLPVIGKYFSAFQHMRAQSADITEYLNKVEREANISVGQLNATIDAEEQRFEATEKAIGEIAVYLVAGRRVHERLRQDFFKQREEWKNSNDPLQLVTLRDMVDFIDTFANNLLDLRISYEDAVQSIPNIRLGQKSAQSAIRDQLVTIYRRVPSIADAIRTICTFSQVAKRNRDAQAANDFDISLRKVQNRLVTEGAKASVASESNYAAKIQMLADTAESQITLLDDIEVMKQDNRVQRGKDLARIEEIHSTWIGAMKAASLKGIDI